MDDQTPAEAGGIPRSVLADMQAREKRRYSIFSAIRSAATRGHLGASPAGFEGEVSSEIARRSGRTPRGFYLPHDAPVERRLMTTTSGAGALQTVWADTFIDVFRPKLVVQHLGGQILSLSTGKGQVQLPVQTSATPTAWVAEGSSAGSNGALALSSVVFVPHTLLCNTGISRFMSDNYSPGFMQWLYDDLGKSIAVGVDAAAINGSGPANSQPLGLMQSPGISSYTLTGDSGNGAAPTYADLVAMELAAGVANADTPADARMGWLTSPAGKGKLRRTDSSALVAGTSGQWCWDRNYNTILGQPAQTTTNVPANETRGSGSSLTSLIYGNFEDLIVNLFDAVDLVFNPFTITTSGWYGLYAYQEVDVQVRRIAAFQMAHGLVTT